MAHEPVLADRVVDYLAPALDARAVVVDATVGWGGHARRILEAVPGVVLVGIDRDPDALEAAGANLSTYGARVRLVRDDFSNLTAILERLGASPVAGVLLDLGVSSPQLDQARRGFSFRRQGPLDMRMDPSQRLSAHEVVNGYPESELVRVIRQYGEERFASRIGRAIVSARPLADTAALAEVVRDAIPAAARRSGPHPVRRTFQAIRMEVNHELEALRAVLPQAVDCIRPGGRFVVISYHSLEDRLVKRAFAEEARGCVCPPDFPICRCDAQARARVLTRRPLRPSAREVETNPRASAARLRAVERLAREEPA